MKMATDFKEVIANVKNAYDIVDFITVQGGIDLHGSGDSLKGLCPFHNESTPSFSVRRNFQTYRCFGCGEHGDIISFYMNTENLSFIDALRRLAEDKGIEFVESESTGISIRQIKECVKKTAVFFVKRFRDLDDEHPAKQEILKRGLLLNSLKYGYAPEGNDTLYRYLKDEGFEDDVILESGVCAKLKKGVNEGKIVDRWRGRLMFVIGDVSGAPVGFSGKKLFDTDKMGKYVNSPDTPVFNKSKLLFNASSARKKAAEQEKLFVAEGQFDVVALKSAGVENSVAALGTAFTESHAQMCRRMVNSGKIVFCFDGDDAGIEAAVKVFKKIPSIHAQSYVVRFPDGQDPCDYLQNHGEDELKKLIEENQIPLMKFVLDVIKGKHDISSDMGKSAYLEEAVATLALVTNDSLIDSAVRTVSLVSSSRIDHIKMMISKNKKDKTEHVFIEDDDSSDSRPEMSTTSDDEEMIVKKIEKSRLYHLSAIICTLALRVDLDEDMFQKVQSSIPKSLRGILDQAKTARNEGKPIIPEAFDMPAVASILLSDELVPTEADFNENDAKSLLLKNIDRLEKEKVALQVRKIKMETARLLDGASNESPEYLKELMEKEKEQIASLMVTDDS